MPFLLQICTKERDPQCDFFRMLLSPRSPRKGALWDMVSDFLVEDGRLAEDHQTITLGQLAVGIYEVVLRRVSTLVGHVWLQYADVPDKDAICPANCADFLLTHGVFDAGLVEFLPKARLLPRPLGYPTEETPWADCTDGHIQDLFGLVVRKLDPQRRRPVPLGCDKLQIELDAVSGGVCHRNGLDEASRRAHTGAFITPPFRSDSDCTAWREELLEDGSRMYSFSPWFNPRADNCLTWVLQTLNSCGARNRLGAAALQVKEWAGLDEAGGGRNRHCGNALNVGRCGRISCFAPIAGP